MCLKVLKGPLQSKTSSLLTNPRHWRYGGNESLITKHDLIKSRFARRTNTGFKPVETQQVKLRYSIKCHQCVSCVPLPGLSVTTPTSPDQDRWRHNKDYITSRESRGTNFQVEYFCDNYGGLLGVNRPTLKGTVIKHLWLIFRWEV